VAKAPGHYGADGEPTCVDHRSVTIWGRILESAVRLSGPLGALLRRATASASRGARAGSGRRHGTKQIAFTIAVIALGAKMAKSDGRVTRDEVTAFREVFHVPLRELANVAKVFDLAKRDTAGYEIYARQIGRIFRDDPDVLEEVLDALFHIAKQDGGVRPAELAYLADVARIFGLGEKRFEQIRAAQVDEDEADPYHVLGVSPTIDAEALKRRWRKLVREHHPDALVAHGMPADFAALAEERLAKINAAYDRIRAERGGKPGAA
jgi:DnaJ like chaperone protein